MLLFDREHKARFVTTSQECQESSDASIRAKEDRAVIAKRQGGSVVAYYATLRMRDEAAACLGAPRQVTSVGGAVAALLLLSLSLHVAKRVSCLRPVGSCSGCGDRLDKCCDGMLSLLDAKLDGGPCTYCTIVPSFSPRCAMSTRAGGNGCCLVSGALSRGD